MCILNRCVMVQVSMAPRRVLMRSISPRALWPRLFLLAARTIQDRILQPVLMIPLRFRFPLRHPCEFNCHGRRGGRRMYLDLPSISEQITLEYSCLYWKVCQWIAIWSYLSYKYIILYRCISLLLLYFLISLHFYIPLLYFFILVPDLLTSIR